MPNDGQQLDIRSRYAEDAQASQESSRSSFSEAFVDALRKPYVGLRQVAGDNQATPANHQSGMAAAAGNLLGDAVVFTGTAAAARFLPGVGKFAPIVAGGVLGFLQPRAADEGIAHRLGNAALGSATIAILERGVAGKSLLSMNRTDQLAATLHRGAAAGALHAQGDSLLRTGQLANIGDTAFSAGTWAVTGGLMHAAGNKVTDLASHIRGYRTGTVFEQVPVPTTIQRQMRSRRADEVEMVIVGGGPHGVHHASEAARLYGADKIAIVDPHPQLLQQWKSLTGSEKVGMTHLRSPIGHYVGPDDFSLASFVKGKEGSQHLPSAYPFERPSLGAFNAHMDAVVRTYHLNRRHLVASAVDADATASGFVLHTTAGDIRAKRMLLAISSNDKPNIPQWAQAAREQGATVNHIFEPGFDMRQIHASESVATIGGGITGAQVSLRAAMTNPGKTTMITRSPIQSEWLDSKPGYHGLQYENHIAFRNEPSLEVRRQLITEARNPGTIPPNYVRQLEDAIRGNQLTYRRGDVSGATVQPNGAITLNISGTESTFDRVILATGLEGGRPGGQFVDNLIRKFGLPVAPDGFPAVQPNLRWGAQPLYVSGALAELGAGPMSRNIQGARISGQLIFNSLRREASTPDNPAVPHLFNVAS